jgi:putative transposase
MMTMPHINPPLIQGEFYHFFNRANSQNDKLFYQQRNYRYFLKLWTEYMEPHFEVWSYCLIPNHFHFLIRVREQEAANRAMEAWRRLAISYTQAINKQEGRRGSLFQEHPKYLSVNSDRHLMNLIRYIHHNPVHHGLSHELNTWLYSSYLAFFNSAVSRVMCAEVIKLFGSVAQFKCVHQQDDDYESIVYCLMDV